MFDFLKVIKNYQKGRYYYKPTFITKSSIKDLMTRGGAFYAIYDEDTGFWTKSKPRAIELIDQQVREFTYKDSGEEAMNDPVHGPSIMTMADSANHLVEQFDRFCKTMGDNWHALDQKMLFSNSEIKRNDYASKTLDYPLVEQPTPYYDALCEVLYLPDEREKWEWAVGSMITGDSTKIQKMFAFYGEPGTGKSTIISKIFADQVFGGIEMGYAVKFEANNLVGGSEFGTDFLENDSVLVYDDDAEMGMITVRSTLNKIISHEQIRVNAKFKPPFMTRANCMIFVGSNDPIQLSPNSGMKRRLIDIRPTGNLVSAEQYDDCIEHIPFEKSGIAWRCLQTYKKLGRHYYDHYIAEDMMARTSPFHNFVIENVMELKDGVSLARAYDIYLKYAEMCKFKNELVRYKFRDTLKLYFDKYEDTKFSGFRWDKIGKEKPLEVNIDIKSWLKFNCTHSDFDEIFENQPAQYANEEGIPENKWDKVKFVLADLDTSKLHYVKLPENVIVLDFDIKDEDGNKSLEKNMIAASKFPPTYAELSKSGSGIHLHYIYTGGDPKELSRIYENNVEVKVFTGNAALRRQLTLCNDIPIAELSSGLPLKEVKGGKKMVDMDGFKNEKILRSMIVKNLKKEYHSATKPSIDFIDKLLTDAYNSGASYDVRDMQNDILAFAMNSSHQADYCVNRVSNMLFCSKDILDNENEEKAVVDEDAPIVIFDTEVSPSYKQYIEYCEKNGIPYNVLVLPKGVTKDTKAHFLICWKFLGEDKAIQKMLDPKPEEVEKLFKYNLVGFNNRAYDNHMIWAASQGYTPEELYSLNIRIIGEKDKKAKFGQAYNLSHTDILDFASAGNKKGLKKWEIELGIDHLEWDRPWYEPIPDNRLTDWVDYCSNDVTSTEKVFYHLQDDYEARIILAKLAGGTPNDTTNSLTIKLLTHGIDNPQSEYIYTDLSTIFPGYEFNPEGIDKERYSTEPGAKVPTKNRKGKSIYMGEDPSEGGFANCTKPGVYFNVGLFDVASMHPHSAIKLKIFGKTITKRYENLVEARVAIKHIKEIGDEAYNEALRRMDAIKEGSSEVIKDILDGHSGDDLKHKCKAIAGALKTAINSVYGLTSAKFDNKLRDPRNVDNIVAKYGALFMITLKHKLQDMGYTVVHIKTDSIKVADYDEKVKKFIMDFGKKYGFTFEHEATYSKMCIVDDAQYIAYEVEADGEKLEKPFWTATGAKFGGPMDKDGNALGAPYLFKTLFSHEPITFNDFPETKSVDDAAIYLVNDNGTDTFVGRVGSFVCVKPEYGSSLMRVKGDKRSAVTGTKDYYWAEAVSVRDYPERINLDYYRAQCDDAIDTINQFYPFDEFVDCDPTDFMFIPEGSPEEVEFNAMNPPVE